jgi:hypothetical protein
MSHNLNVLFIITVNLRFLNCPLTAVVWLVAESEAIQCQGTMHLIKGKVLKLALRRQLTIPHVSNRPFLFFGYLKSNINKFANPQTYLST